MKYGIHLDEGKRAPAEVRDSAEAAQRYVARYGVGDERIVPLREVEASFKFLVPADVPDEQITTVIANAEMQFIDAEAFDSDDETLVPVTIHRVTVVTQIEGQVV